MHFILNELLQDGSNDDGFYSALTQGIDFGGTRREKEPLPPI